MKKLKFIIGKIDTIDSCVISNQTPAVYSDTIVKDQNYSNVTVKNIKLKNICSQAFTVPAKILFSQQDSDNSTFTASINAVTVPANSEVDVPVYYNGIYKNANLNPSFPFTINGINMMYDLTVTVSNIQIINIVRDLEMGSVLFDVVVSGEPFVGYACGLFMSATSNSKQIVGTINTGVGQIALKVLSGQPIGAKDRVSSPVNIPIGSYFGDMLISTDTVPIEEGVSADLSLSFALTNVYEDGIMGANVTATYTRFAIEA